MQGPELPATAYIINILSPIPSEPKYIIDTKGDRAFIGMSSSGWDLVFLRALLLFLFLFLESSILNVICFYLLS